MGIDWGFWALVAIVLSTVFQFFVLKRLGAGISAGVQTFIDSFKENLLEPNVKKAFSIIGSQGKNTQNVATVKDEIAKGILDKKLGPYKMIAEIAGVDIDSLVERFGAETLLQAGAEMLPQMGFNLEDIAGNLLGGEKKGNTGKNPYW